jgi:hypothetical protein
MTLMAVIPPVGGPYELRIYVCPLAPRLQSKAFSHGGTPPS